jgi:ribonuclease P protein component
VASPRKRDPRKDPAAEPAGAIGSRFGKNLRLRRRQEFLAIQRRGRRRQSPNFIVVYVDQSAPRTSRFGFSVSRRVGNAVVRNRVKRRLREFVRLHRHGLPRARDFVVIAKPGAAKLCYAELVAELRQPFSL